MSGLPIVAHDGGPMSIGNAIPSRAPNAAPSHRCTTVSAGAVIVSTAMASVGSQKNVAGQRGPRRSAMRACT